MYYYRKLTPKQRTELLDYRRRRSLPLHSPPHGAMGFSSRYLITAACFEHEPILGKSSDRLTDCEYQLLSTCEKEAADIYGWCVLPNHYHVLLATQQIKSVCKALGRFHGRSSFAWNADDDSRGRKVWFRCFDREIRSERHFWATLNYIHHNPVHHGLVNKWQDWIWSSAASFLDQTGRERAEQVWEEYPILDYGKDWDI